MRFHSVVRLGILLCGAAVPLVSFAQFQQPSKDELNMVSDPKAPGAPAVYLDRAEASQDPNHFTTVYARLKVLNPDGLKAATVHISYHRNFVYHATGDNSSHMASGTASSWSLPSSNRQGEDQPWDAESYDVRTEVGAIEGRTIHPDGTVVPLTGKSSEILHVKKGNHQPDEMYFTMPNVTVGSIIEYRYQIRYDRFDLPPDWQVQRRYFVHREHFSFIPAEQFLPERNHDAGSAGTTDSASLDPHGEAMTDVRYAQLLPTGKFVRPEASGAYTLDLTDVPAFPTEAFGPPEESLAYRVRFFYSPTPDPSEFWKKEMGHWIKGLDNYTASTQALKSTVAEICSSSDTPLEKAKKLYDLVQKLDNTDFLPSGAPSTGSETFPLGKVEKILMDKKGTSNQITYLYLALVRVAGINARAERIASRSVRIFDPTLLVADQLDTVLVALNIDGKEILVDPGTKFAPFETLHWAHTGAGGVAMDNSGKVQNITTPMQKNTDNSTLRVGTLTISPQGAVSGIVKVAFLGQRAIELRQLGLLSGQEAVREAVDKMVGSQIPAGVQAKVDHMAYLDDSSKQLLAVIPVSGTFSSQANGRIALPRFFFESRETNPFPANGDRTLPVDMRYPAQEQEQITYQLPAGYSLETKPEDSTLRFAENAAYQGRSKTSGESVTNARVLARGFTFLAPNDYDQLRDFYQKVIAADQQQLVLTTAQAASAQ
jgi:hypothetical protein